MSCNDTAGLHRPLVSKHHFVTSSNNARSCKRCTFKWTGNVNRALPSIMRSLGSLHVIFDCVLHKSILGLAKIF